MLFSNEFILDDKKMRKNIYCSGWGAISELVPKGTQAQRFYWRSIKLNVSLLWALDGLGDVL
ncbi:hypothetical protein BUQ74_14755 [Leptospira weilii serovar Heyan]|nr:hypothetical protein BUQ74_14755 [Leptospira weilii serovar Heyan]